MLARTWLLCLFGLLTPDTVLACGRAELKSLIELAQTLSVRTEGVGRPLLACPNDSAEAAQWLAFYRAVAPGAMKNAPIRGLTVRSNTAGEVGKSISSAYSGSEMALKAKIESGDPRYAQSAEAQLAVGRLLVRAGRFAEGRSYYENFMRLQADNFPEEAEYLYTYIWERDFDRAERELTSVSTSGAPTDFVQEIERGKALVKGLRTGQAPQAVGNTSNNAGGTAKSTPYSAMLDVFAIKDELRRYTGSVRYDGILFAEWQHHMLTSEVYDQASLNTDILEVGKSGEIKSKVVYNVRAGYMAHGSQHFLGEANASLKLPRKLSLGVGGYRRPMFTNVPLAKPALGLVEDGAYVNGGWNSIVGWTSSYLQDYGEMPFERHELSLRQPIKAATDNSHRTYLLASGLYEARPRPSPNYETYRKTQRLGIGGEFDYQLGDWDAGTNLVYLLYQRQPHGDTTYLRQSGLDATFRLSSDIGPSLNLIGAATYHLEETDLPLESTEQRLAVTLALQLLQ